jgi:hypothetical protein
VTYSDSFQAFWLAYRCKRRVNKLQAFMEWQRHGCDADASEVMAGLERFKATDQWREGFMPEPARWLKWRRWEDEPDEAPEASNGDGWDVTGAPKP